MDPKEVVLILFGIHFTVPYPQYSYTAVSNAICVIAASNCFIAVLVQKSFRSAMYPFL